MVAGKTHRDLIARCSELSRTRFGIILREEVLAADGSKDFIQLRLNSGLWKKLHQGIYADASVPPTFEQSVLAAVLHVGPRTFASGPTAARLWRIPGFTDGPIHVLTKSSRIRSTSRVTVHQTRLLDPIDTATVKGIPLTSAARTLLDLCGVVSEETADRAIDDVIRRGLTSPARLRWFSQCRTGSGRPGSKTFKSLMVKRPKGNRATESGLELKFARLIEKRRLPAPVRQHPLTVNGTTLRADFAYPAAKLLIEVDSYKYHGGRAPWVHDARKRNAVASLGWTILIATEDDIDTGCFELLDTVEKFVCPVLDL